MNYAIIGCGMSGLAIANILKSQGKVTIFEKDSRPGGMIKCDSVQGSLFHRTGGHVFNTKRQDVMDWFWQHFDRDREFLKAVRNSSVVLEGSRNVPYPIENHMHCFSENVQKAFIADLLQINSSAKKEPTNFEEFLKGCFGETLYNLYFKPYNYKVWRRDLTQIPLSWLVGKLPMPTVEEMIFNNMNHVEERTFVHSSFYYPRHGGSQFLANRLTEGLNIVYNKNIQMMEKTAKGWLVDGWEFDKVIFCGNIKQMPQLVTDKIEFANFTADIAALESHGTTSVFCEIEQNPYSWMYMPSRKHESHRIICTGNFSPANNAEGCMTGTIEFTDYLSKEDILDNLKRIPYVIRYLDHHYEQYTYPIQKDNTRILIKDIKSTLESHGIFLLGRFAEWEYYNMDVAIGAALDLYNQKLKGNG